MVNDMALCVSIENMQSNDVCARNITMQKIISDGKETALNISE
jgi:hypothetical protein